MPMKKDFIFIDYMVYNEFCNSACRYCRGYFKDGIRFIRNDNQVKMPDSWNSEIPKLVGGRLSPNPEIDQILNLIKETESRLSQYINAPIIKLSGGELFIIEEIIDVIEYFSSKYPIVQILTNGTLLNDRLLDRIIALPNVHVQISLDHYIKEYNQARYFNDKMLSSALHAIERLSQYNIPLEINCVLTKYNTDKLYEFIGYLHGLGNENLRIFPRPVRDKPREILYPSMEQIKTIEKIISDYDKLSAVLPPIQYFHRLYRLMLGELRRTCKIPFGVISAYYIGDVTACPLIYKSPLDSVDSYDQNFTEDLPTMGNIYQPQVKKIFDIVQDGEPYKKMLHEESDYCRECFNQYEIINLYIDGEISKDELRTIPIYSNEAVFNAIEKVKEKILNTYGQS